MTATRRWTLILGLWACASFASAQEVQPVDRSGDSPVGQPASAVPEDAVPEATDTEPRSRLVCPLKHIPALDVANTISQVLRAERRPETGPVLVLPEPSSNSLLISASPAVCEEITQLIEQLDRKPAMVSLELLIAEVTYRDAEETPAGDAPTGAESRPGPPEIVGLPGDSQFSAERLLKELGLEARAGSAPAGGARVEGARNQKPRRVEVLSRVQLTASNNQPASIQVGKQEPVIRGSQVSRTGGRINNVTLEHVGLLVSVTPRIAPDGHVTMEFKIEESRLGPVDEGVPLASGEGHAEVRMPRTVTTSLETTVTAADGQTVVLGGLITKSASRRVDLVILVSPRVVRGGAR